jgi:hypothetical protein
MPEEACSIAVRDVCVVRDRLMAHPLCFLLYHDCHDKTNYERFIGLQEAVEWGDKQRLLSAYKVIFKNGLRLSFPVIVQPLVAPVP